MITGISIENFKGIGKPGISLELKPVTMLFGDNSAGKSSILHAIQLAYEVLVCRNMNPDGTSVGGSSVDLGGFETFFHGGIAGRNGGRKQVTISFDLDLSGEQLDVEHPMTELFIGKDKRTDVSEVGADVWSANIEFMLEWDPEVKRAFVTTYAVALDGEHFATIEYSDATGFGCEIFLERVQHPVIAWPDGEGPLHHGAFGIIDALLPQSRTFEEDWFLEGEEVGPESLDVLPDDYAYFHKFDPPAIEDGVYRLHRFGTEDIEVEMVLQIDATGDIHRRLITVSNEYEQHVVNDPDWDRAVNFGGHMAESIKLHADTRMKVWDAFPNLMAPLRINFDSFGSLGFEEDEITEEQDTLYRKALTDLLTRLIVVPGRILARELEQLRHIGPLRKIPSRNHRPRLTTERSRWSDGLAAWDALYESDELVKTTSEWLTQTKHGLGTGYSVVRNSFREFPSDGLVVRTLLDRESPLDMIEFVRQEVKDYPESVRLMLRDETKQIDIEPHDVAVGITQVVPVVVAAIDGHDGITCIEQPELHNHPSVEVGLGDLFINTIEDGQEYCRFILETHGEHLILRMLRRIRETTEDELPEGVKGLKPDDIAVYYIQRESEGVTAMRLRIDETGEFIDKWPNGFFRERSEELF